MSAPPDREVAVFSAALELPASQRDAYLQGACADDPTLRLHLEALLRVHEEARAFLEHPALGSEWSPTGVPNTTVRMTVATSQKAGDRIGRYRLLQQIGEGGCGVVYMADQEEPVRRRVALKVIKLGMDTWQVIARFEAERQALALMDHPNIAKVFDAGATEAGRPYFVMELVKGIPITRYCDENNLNTVARLGLFVQVCQAIQHAHQKGIIHRDIKPSNVLVADHDGVPVPKIIDFGIAKATTDQRLTDKTLFTALEQFIGTPAYMSPEQAKLSGLDIDTRTDIYSLGVLLYELLTGRTPFEAKRLLEAGLEEIRRIIREEEPLRPSTKLHTLDGAEQTTVARHRQSELPKLVHLIRGDLDWIVMKALEKDRARRYETANGLAADVQRHLNNEPVVARPPSNFYRFEKLARRNKVAFAAASAVATALIIGLVASTWLLVKETRARQRAVVAETVQNQLRARAQSEAEKSREVAQFFGDLLEGGIGPSVASGRDTRMLRELLDRSAGRLGREFTAQPAVEAGLRETLGKAYFDIGDYEKAEKMHREALAMLSKLHLREHPDVLRSLNNLANALSMQGKLAEAEPLFRETLEWRRKLLRNQHPDVANSLNNLGNVLALQGKVDQAEPLFREALAMRRKILGNEDPAVVRSLNSLATVLVSQGKLAEAEDLRHQAKAIIEGQPGRAK